MPDVLTRLQEADPLRGEHPPDPRAPHAQALLARARADAPTTTPGRARLRDHRARRPALALAATAAVAGAAVLLSGGLDGGSPPDARAAMIRSAGALPVTGSGLITTRSSSISDADGEVLDRAVERLRFAGGDIDASGSYEFRQESTGQLTAQAPTAFRVVDGRLFVRLDGRPWEARPGAPTPPDLGAQAHAASSRAAATALATALAGVTRTAAGDGGTQYTGTITPAALKAAYNGVNPFMVERITAHSADILDGIHVRMRVGADGGLQTIAFTWRTPWTHPTLASATLTITLDYTQLASPQTITAP
jgi:hypothetical protein